MFPVAETHTHVLQSPDLAQRPLNHCAFKAKFAEIILFPDKRSHNTKLTVQMVAR